MRRRAAFLDRDGTIIHDAEYLGDPVGVQLLAGAAAAVTRLNAVGIPVVMVTNQSGIARGLLDAADYARVHARLIELLAGEGAQLSATYMCPHHPDFTGTCECRKPGTLLYRQAADALHIDLAESWYVGDRWRDVAPGLTFGGRGVLLRSGAASDDELARGGRERGVSVVDSLAEAVDLIAGNAGR